MIFLTSFKTPAGFNVCVDISSVPRERKNNQPLTYPRFALRDCEPPTVQNNQLSDVEKNRLYESLCIDEEENRDHSHSERWKLERKYSFTASHFYLIFHRQICSRNHVSKDALDTQLMGLNMSQ